MKSATWLTVSTVVFFWAAMPGTAATKVFLLGGQSNMAGVGGYPGDNGPFPADLPLPSPYNVPQSAVKFWNYGTPPAFDSGEYLPTRGNGWIDLQNGFGLKPTEFGPEVSFGYRLHQLYPDDEIYLVKYGISSTNLAVHWNPDGSGGRYNAFLSRVGAAMQNLTAAGKSPAIAGMIWMQGENDAINTTYASAYLANLRDFIGEVRTDVDAPDMRFVLGRITSYYDTDPSYGNLLVRNAQVSVTSQVANTAWIDTDDLERAYVGHYGTQGQIDLGIRFANAFAPVPEPSTFVLAGTAMILLAGYRRRQRVIVRN